MSILLHISDPHFGTERRKVVDALVALARQLAPDLVVLSGDVTQRARPAQFAEARRFMQRLDAPWVAIPGNHDIPLFDIATRVLHPYSRYCTAFGVDLEPVHETAELLVVCVNTSRAYRHKHGELSADQVARVARHLGGAAPGQLRVVVVHQPVAVPDANEAGNLVRGRLAALPRWAEAGADLVLAGHIHWPHVQALPQPARTLWAVNAGTAVSSRVRPGIPNSVNVIRWGRDATPGRCRIERWDCAAPGDTFVRVGQSELMPQRAPAPTA